MENNGQIAKPRMSLRLQYLFAAAMRLATLAELSVELAEAEACQLAAFGNLETALARLRDRMTVRRAIPGVQRDQRSQVRLAIYELAAEAKGDHEAVQEIIRRGLEAEAAAAASASRETEKIRDAAKIFEESRASSSAGREFIRRADRLRIRQVNQLRTSIFDEGALERALVKLYELYSRYITQAVDD
jgi:hypothetical protein